MLRNSCVAPESRDFIFVVLVVISCLCRFRFEQMMFERELNWEQELCRLTYKNLLYLQDG